MTSADEVRFIKFCIQYSSIALVFYDYSLTWTREVIYFWRKKFTISTALYIACRYSMISNVLYALALAGKLEGVRCDTGYRICAAFSVVGRAAIIFVWGARTYAVFARNKLILLFFSALGIVIVVVDSIHVHWVVCVGSPGNQTAELLLAIFMVVYEVLSAAFTTIRGWQALRIRHDIDSQSTKLEFMVMQQGILYFCFISIFTLGALITLNTTPSGSFIQRLLNAFTLPISGIMTARFLLHLREWDARANTTTTTTAGNSGGVALGPLVFERAGDVGESSSLSDEFGYDPVVQARRMHMPTRQAGPSSRMDLQTLI